MPPHLVEVTRCSQPSLAIGTTATIGDARIALFAVEGTVFAVEDACAHCASPIAHGAVSGRVLTCPGCGWRYDLATGASEPVAAIRLHTFPVCVEPARILVEWTDATG